MHLPIPCSSPVEIPSFLGLSPKFLYSASTCSLYLLSVIGFAVLGVALSVRFLSRKSRSKEEFIVQKSEKEQIRVPRRTWSYLVSVWDGISWPVTLTPPPPNAVVGRGVGLNRAVLGKQMSQPIRNAISCDQSFPTIYQSKEPVSMAKMIMSRHTFRRPSGPTPRTSQAAPRRTTLPPPPAPSSKPQSMV